MNIQGTWFGHYKDQLGEKIHFRLIITQDGSEFSGVCYDLFDPEVKSEVKGFIEEELISFTKIYETPLMMDDFGNIYEDPEDYHPGVNYYGKYDRIGKIFAGAWEIETDEDRITEELYEIEFTSGTWTMNQQQDSE